MIIIIIIIMYQNLTVTIPYLETGFKENNKKCNESLVFNSVIPLLLQPRLVSLVCVFLVRFHSFALSHVSNTCLLLDLRH